VLMAMFLVFLAAQMVTGLYEYNATQREHGQPLVSMARYLATGHPWEALFENWESEFLRMAAFVLLTTWLVQKGSPESRRPGAKELVDTDPRDFAHDPEVPSPVRRGGWILRLYEHSLGLAFILLFLLSWIGHALGGFSDYASEEVLHHQPQPTLTDYLTRLVSGSSRFRTGRVSSSPSRRWCGSPCTFDNGGRRNPNRCTHGMPRRDVKKNSIVVRA
jgi:hypothetical protein